MATVAPALSTPSVSPLQHPGMDGPAGGPAFPARVERATLRFGGACSFLLSYGNVVPGEGVEPSWARRPTTF